MSGKRYRNQKHLQDLILRGYKSPRQREDEHLCVSRTFTKLQQEEASMNQYMLKLKCLLKNLTLLEEGMVYVGKMKPISFEPIYVLAQMQAKLYKFRNRLGNLPKEHRKYAHNLIGNAYDRVIDQCVKGAQGEECLKKIVSDVAYIDDIIMKFTKKNVQNSLVHKQTNICPLINKNNIQHKYKLPVIKVYGNDCKFKYINNKRIHKQKNKYCTRESGFLDKIEKVAQKYKKIESNTADKTVSASIETEHNAMQYDPKLSGPVIVPESFGEVETKIRSPWLANTKASTDRDSIEEDLPPNNNFHYEVSMRHATTDIVSSKNTKETQTIILGVPSGDYEYTVMDMTYTKERIISEKTKDEMVKNLTNKQVFFLSETDIFETMSSNKTEDSDSSSGTFIEDSDCTIKISNVESKPCYKQYKMLYSSNKDETTMTSNNKTPVKIDKNIIEHRDEILAYIKELSTILVNSRKAELGEDSDTDVSLTT